MSENAKLRIICADTDELKLSARKLWYDVYCREMGRNPSGANHTDGTISDLLDAQCILYVALAENNIVGTIRANYPRDGDVGYYREFYQLDRLNLNETSVVTRIVIAPEFRKTFVSAKLSAAMFERTVLDGVRWGVCDCNDPVLPFFKRLGFAVHVPRAQHPDYGTVTIMKMDNTDPSMRIPRYSLIAKFLSSNNSVTVPQNKMQEHTDDVKTH